MSNATNTDVYYTPPDSADITPLRDGSSGWVPAPWDSSILITALPLTDSRTELFARPHYDNPETGDNDAKTIADLYGAELFTEQDFINLHKAAQNGTALELSPCAQVFSTDDFQHMMSLEWARRHDKCVHDQLNAHWDGKQAVSNVGKYWLDKGYNFGWFSQQGSSVDSAGDKIIQSKGGAHIDPKTGKNTHTDYSQLIMLKKAA